MNPRAAVAAALAVAGLATFAIIEVRGEKPLEVLEKCDLPAQLGRDADGGKVYTCAVIVDAGLDCSRITPPEACELAPVYERRRLTQSTHVRAVRDDGTCLIREPMPGVVGLYKAPRFFGLYNRFPRAWAVGSGCEEVAGMVDDKRDGEVEESELLTRDGGSK
ncbi:MAG: hypothetical protein Q8K32_09285 [Archangium sp.]|nr:hypothetical protein [Archangium sp.]